MKKSKNSASKSERSEYFEGAALDSLLYWVNTTYEVIGANKTMSTLTEVLGTCILEYVPKGQIERAERVITEHFALIFETLKKEAKVFEEESDKDSMN